MKKEIAIKLKEKMQWIANTYSNPNREKNQNNETFSIDKTIPLSEYAAAGIFNKSSGKKALAFLFFVGFQDGYWGYFFLKESHVYGLTKIPKILQTIEEHNYKQNFQEELHTYI